MELLKEYDFDSLAFVDTEYDTPEVQNAVHSLISNEMRTFAPPNYIANFNYPSLKFANSPALQAEWSRVVASGGAARMKKELDESRYLANPPSRAQETVPEAWSASLSNAKKQYEHNQINSLNLELAHDHQSEEWLNYNKFLEHSQAFVDNNILMKKRKFDQVQIQRRTFQEDIYGELQRCEAMRVGAWSKQVQIVASCRALLKEHPDVYEQFSEIIDQVSESSNSNSNSNSRNNNNINNNIGGNDNVSSSTNNNNNSNTMDSMDHSSSNNSINGNSNSNNNSTSSNNTNIASAEVVDIDM